MSHRARQGYNTTPLLAGAAVVAVGYGLIHLGQALTPGAGEVLSWNPLSMVMQLTQGVSVWPVAATWLLVIGALVTAAVVIALAVRSPRTGRRAKASEVERRVNADANAARLQHSRRSADARVLHPDVEDIAPGVHVGRTLDLRPLWVFQSYRQCSVHVWGPGRGKPTSEVIRHAFYAPGPYAMTSNKTDGVRQVLAARAAAHPAGAVWILDPDRIFRTGTRPAFTFDLLASVTDTEKALDLAMVFENASKTGDERGGDAQFEPAGRELLAWLMLAAASDHRPLQQVHKWASAGEFIEPANILRAAGYRGPVDALLGLSTQADRTRASVFATTQRMSSAMVHDHLMAWVSPTPGVPVFDPARFVVSVDTLIMLSQDKAGPLAAFVSGLVIAVVDAARAQASRQASERLAVPLIADLDECGNVVTLPQLPDWYTHFGSKGIIINAYFQSPAQGEAMYGLTGFKQLWDAAGMRVYGGGIDDPKWLRELSDLLGTYEKQTVSTTTSSGSRSQSRSTQERARITVAELAGLPEWRAVIRTSDGISLIVETVPVFSDPIFTAILDEAARIGGPR